MTKILLAEETDAKELRNIAIRAFNDDYVLYGSILIPLSFIGLI
jgi:hypothetical protein